MGEGRSDPRVDDLLATPKAGGMAVRGGVTRTFGYGLGLAITLASAPLLTRHLGVVDFGGYVTVLSLATIIALIGDAGLTVIGVREYAIREPDDRSRLMANILSLRLLIGILGTLAATGFAVAANYTPSLIVGTAAAGIGVVLALGQQTWTIPLAAGLRLGVVTVLDLLRQVLSVAGVLLLIALGAGVAAFLAVSIPVGIVVGLVTGRVIYQVAKMSPGFDLEEWRVLLREALPVAAASILAALFYRIAIVIMSVLSTDEETGYFSISLRVIEAIIPIPSLITSAAFPILVHAARDAEDRLVYGLQRLFEVGLILGAWTALGLVLGAEPVIQFLGGDEFDSAVPVLQIQGIATAASFLFAVWAAGLWAIGAQRSLLIASGVGVGSVVALTAVLAPTEGATGTAIAMTASETVLAGTAGLLLMRHRHLRLNLRIVPKVVAALGAGLLVSLTGLPQIVVAVLASLVYFAVLVALRAIPPDIRHAFLERLRRSDPAAD